MARLFETVRRSSVHILSLAFLLALSACTGVHRGHLFAVPGPDAQPLAKSKGVITLNRGVAVAAAAQNEVKEADAFYFVVFNRSNQYLSYDRSKVLLLDHNGKEYKPLSRSQKNFLIGARYKPKPPIGFSTDIFRLDRRYEEFGDVNVSPLNPGEVFQSKVMPGGRDSFFVYFQHRRVDSPSVTIILPGLELGATKEQLTFLFKFEVQEE